jgi:uncharacterized membrane protein (DUF2068 family)
MTKHSEDLIRIAAVFEAAKGLLVLITGFGLLLFIHKDLHLLAEQIVRNLHLNPAREYPKIFVDAADHITDIQLLALAVSAGIYSVVRLIEAYGLWFHRQWAEWFGVITGGIYIPAEVYELSQGVTMIKLVILIINVMIVASLGNALYVSSREY